MMMSLEELRLDGALKQKKGLHFIIASIFIWSAIFIIHLTSIPILTKNLFTFCCAAFLVPLAYFISRIIKVDFQNKKNPLTKLGIIFSLNQFLYLLIVMWVYPTIPEKMVMVLAMVFGAHLLPFGWLYKSSSYTILALIIPIVSLVVGIIYPPYVLAMVMMFIELIFSVSLIIEINKLKAITHH
jgi:hypothetical protein